MNSILHNVEFVVVEASAAAGTTELTTDVIDMAGWHGVAFIAHLGDVTTGSVLGFVADHSDEDDGGWDDLEGPLAFTAGASDADNKLLVLDLVRPAKRFVRARLSRTVANAVLGGVVAVKYGPTFSPVTQGATVLASATLANPTAA
ncbi:MAG: hypothetical protein ACOH2N_13400 [Devosia sp.]